MKNTPWQAVVNLNTPSNFPNAENKLQAVKNAEGNHAKLFAVSSPKVVMPKRYSFDGNGGGYAGL